MKLGIEQYNEIISVALDHRLEFLKGKTVFDDCDFGVREDGFFRSSLQRHYAEKDLFSLKKMLISLIHTFFRFQDEYNFADYLFQKTGYRIKPIPKEQIGISHRRRLYISVGGTGERALTQIQILLPESGGCIYCIRGSYPDINAVWVERHRIEIKVPAIAEELERVRKVKYHGEIIDIVYNEPEA
jgi:hypothetical protein